LVVGTAHEEERRSMLRTTFVEMLKEELRRDDQK